jgi:hypothetical protein
LNKEVTVRFEKLKMQLLDSMCMSTQYRLVQSGKTASGGCSAGQGSSEPVAPRTLSTLPLSACMVVAGQFTSHKNKDVFVASGHKFL